MPLTRVRVTDLEWKVTYVGSADTEEYDQVLDSVLVGPVTAGQYRFVLQVSLYPAELQGSILPFLRVMSGAPLAGVP